jgi:hypothetical protein
MTDRQPFGVVVRAVGLLLAVWQGLVNWFASLSTALDIQKPMSLLAQHRFIEGACA